MSRESNIITGVVLAGVGLLILPFKRIPILRNFVTWLFFLPIFIFPLFLLIALILAVWWWWRGPQSTPANLRRLSSAWKWNLYLHAGCASFAAAALLVFVGMSETENWWLACLAFAGAVIPLTYNVWYWLRVHPYIRPIKGIHDEPQTELSQDLATIFGLAAVGQIAANAMEGLDHVDLSTSSASASFAAASGTNKFHNGSGGNIEVHVNGNVYSNGKFLGHRNASGGITDGSGNFLGTLRADGALFSSNGSYTGRLFK